MWANVVSMTASGYRRLLSRMIPGMDCNWGAASGREPLNWWAADQRVSFVGTVLATALRKFNREKANGSFQIYVVACGRSRRVGGLIGRCYARSRTSECG